MKKFINKTEDITKELLEGYVMAYQDRVKLGAENIVVRTHPKSEDKVAIVTMGGSGHEPALSGYVGGRDARLFRSRRYFCRSGCTARVPGFTDVQKGCRDFVGGTEPFGRPDECQYGL